LTTKRWILAGAAAAVVLGASYLAGRAPGRYALEQACERYQADRRAREAALQEEIGRQIQAGDAAGARRTQDAVTALLREVRREDYRGWEVLLVPTGAARPEARDFLVLGRHDPSSPRDPATLRGAMEIWLAPRGALPRLLYALGLAP